MTTTNHSTQKAFVPFLMVLVPLWATAFLYLFPLGPLDLLLAKLAYTPGKGWLLANSDLARIYLYKGAKVIPAVFGVGAFVLYLFTFVKKDSPLTKYRNAFLYVVLGIVLSVLAVSGLKSLSSQSCPWTLQIFGGSGVASGRCFPAGHAGAGFSLLCLYFAARRFFPALSKTAFWVIVLLGFANGFMRQFQGAHYLSHTLATFAIDWIICCLLYRFTIGKDEPVEKGGYPKSLWLLSSLIALYWLLVFNQPLFSKIGEFLKVADARTISITASVFGVLFFANAAAPLLFVRPVLVKSILTFLTICASFAYYFAVQYGTVIDADMVRNAISTDPAEAAELITATLVWQILFLNIPPLWLIWKSPIKNAGFLKDLARSWIPAALFITSGLAVLFLSFQGISSLVRGEPIVRHMITPLNTISATVKTFLGDSNPSAKRERIVIDPSPSLGPTHQNKKGVLFVVVVGETARLANWGLAGYSRNTTPELAKRGVIAFRDTTACGSSTDVSLPCMFSRVGRKNYDRDRILAEESLLPLLKRAGTNVYWVDNQSGSKGVSDGVEELKIDTSKISSLCQGGRCMDEALIAGLDPKVVTQRDGATILFLHQLGNHGPSYYKRYPKDFEVFTPACKSEQLQNCTQQEVINAYDNALLYTDQFLAGVIDWLKGMRDVDTGMLYISDHGESLGEKNLYLHGAPYAIAPDEQIKVPMVLWLSKGMEKRIELSEQCMQAVAKKPASHDNLFSTLLGILDVKSSAYDPSMDLTAQCRNPAAAEASAKK